MALDIIGNLIAGVIEAAVEIAFGAIFETRRSSQPPSQTDPTRLQWFGMMFGMTLALAGCLGLGVSISDWRWQNYVLAHSGVPALIVAAKRTEPEASFTDVLLNYERRTSDGVVACEKAPARLNGWSADFEVGKAIQVFPQPGSCYRPIYAPDIRNPLPVLLLSLIALPLGIACFWAGHSSHRNQRDRILRDMLVVDARNTTDISVVRKVSPS
jgi:hypothetical protein